MKKILKLFLPALLAACAAIPGAKAAQNAPCDVKDPMKTLRPIMATHTMPPYPKMSVMTEEQGTTVMNVIIGADGVPTDIQIEKTSGAVRLDEAARDHVKQNWRWAPVADGCTAWRTRLSIKWDLRDAPPPEGIYVVAKMKPEDFPPGALARHEKGVAVVNVVLRPDASFAAVQIATGSGFPDLDDQSLTYARARHWTPGRMDGQQVFTLFQIVLFWGVDPPPAGAPR